MFVMAAIDVKEFLLEFINYRRANYAAGTP
jgi:hypothetical protein